MDVFRRNTSIKFLVQEGEPPQGYSQAVKNKCKLLSMRPKEKGRRVGRGGGKGKAFSF